MDGPAPDYRTQRSTTLEGNSRARTAWEHFHFDIALSAVEEAYATTWTPTNEADRDDIPAEVMAEMHAGMIEDADLLGFWLAWHRAGGFTNLEHAGWNRATIFRRIRRFRTRYGAHPDDYQPNWIHLDLHTTWSDDLRSRIDNRQATP